MSQHIRPENDTKIFLKRDQYLQVRQRGKNYGDFALVYKKFLLYVQQQAPETLGTLVVLIWHNDVKNITRATHEFLATESGVSIPTIARHMKRFRELGVVINDVQVPYACYLIHPLLAWKGKAAERDVYLAGLGSSHPFSELIEKLKNKPDGELEPEEE
jgi:hypothetical protein